MGSPQTEVGRRALLLHLAVAATTVLLSPPSPPPSPSFRYFPIHHHLFSDCHILRISRSWKSSLRTFPAKSLLPWPQHGSKPSLDYNSQNSPACMAIGCGGCQILGTVARTSHISEQWPKQRPFPCAQCRKFCWMALNNAWL